jgi:hypothetical protein
MQSAILHDAFDRAYLHSWKGNPHGNPDAAGRGDPEPCLREGAAATPISAIPPIVLRVTFDFSDIVDAPLMNARQLLHLIAVAKSQ